MMKRKGIALALSGGGIRALVFHAGVLYRLARQGLLESVSFVSTVSGGSLAVGLIFHLAGERWPSSDEYCRLLPSLRRTLTTSSLECSYLLRCFFQPWLLLRGRARVVGECLHRLWGIQADIRAIPSSPRWIICATTFETGKNWIFSHKRMGDYVANYVLDPKFSLCDAMAASAAVPGLIGPLTIRSKKFKWHRFSKDGKNTEPVSPSFRSITLWDGGVYDNLGVEPIRKPFAPPKEGSDYLIVADASAPVASTAYSWCRSAMRLVDIARDQVRSVRARELVKYFEEFPGSGVYLRIGNTYKVICGRAGKEIPLGWPGEELLSDQNASAAENFPTTLRKLSSDEFRLLFRHGYEVADATLSSYDGANFPSIPISETDFEKTVCEFPH